MNISKQLELETVGWLCIEENRGFKKDATMCRVERHTECQGLAKLVCLVLRHLKAGRLFFYREFGAAFDLLVLSQSCRKV